MSPKFMIQENEGKCVYGKWDKGIYLYIGFTAVMKNMINLKNRL